MRRLRAIWIVTKWEFTTTVLRTSFLVVLFSLPIVHIGIAALLGSRCGPRRPSRSRLHPSPWSTNTSC